MFYLVLSLILAVFVYKLIKISKYWEYKNVVHEPALPIVGNMGMAVFRKKHAMEIGIDLYKKYSGHRYVGFMQFTRPMLMLRDVDLIKQITIKDFDHFQDRFNFGRIENDPLMSKSLVLLTGHEWKQMRTTLSPVFTSSKMRFMYQLMADCAENFVGHFRGKEKVAVDMKDIFSRFTTDVIATTAFGIQINSLDEPKNTFFTMGGRINQGILNFAKLIIFSKFPSLLELTGTQLLPKDVGNFFRSIIKDNINKREKGGIVRPDLVHLLMEARKGRLKQDSGSGSKNEGFAAVEESNNDENIHQKQLTDDDIVGQAIVFFLAGFETASTASSFLAYELAVHLDIQKKLQEEIDEVNRKCKEKIPYETLLSMKYFDQVISEGLRLWTPGFQIDRVCTKDYVIEPKNPDEKEISITKGESVLIPIGAIHRDPQYYPDPEKFDPERFNDENKSKILPSAYMPFGIGPRNCIGSRFALLEMKILFFHLLSKFDIVPVNGTQIPLRISSKKINLAPERGFRLGFKPRKI